MDQRANVAVRIKHHNYTRCNHFHSRAICCHCRSTHECHVHPTLGLYPDMPCGQQSRRQIAHKKEVAAGCPCRIPRSFGSQPRCWEGADRQAPTNWRYPAKPGWASAGRCQPPPSPYTIQAICTYRYTIHTSPALTMFSIARRLPLTRPVAGARLFHASAPAFVKVGDKLPNVDLVEGSPGNKVNLAKELTGKGVIIGMSRVSNSKFECHF
jgi:hypothetical protein